MKIPQKKFESKPGFNGCPLICLEANLPSFDDRKEIEKFRTRNGGDHPHPVLATWRCHACGKLHFYSCGSATDSNGGFKAGAEKIPKSISLLLTRKLAE